MSDLQDGMLPRPSTPYEQQLTFRQHNTLLGMYVMLALGDVTVLWRHCNRQKWHNLQQRSADKVHMPDVQIVWHRLHLQV